MALAAISVHQGGAGHPSPATYESYRAAAAESGVEYVELDVRRTRDGILVVHHDEHLDVVGHHDEHDEHAGHAGRAAGRSAPAVADLTYDELCEHLGHPAPRVAEVLAILADRVSGHLDLKETGYEDAAVGLALEALGPKGFVVTTLEDSSIARITEAFPDVRTALSLGRDLGGLPAYERTAARLSEIFPVRRLKACGAQWAALNYRLVCAGVLRRCAAHGLGTMLWTVDRDELISRFLKDPRVDVVITNHPQRARVLRDKLGA